MSGLTARGGGAVHRKGAVDEDGRGVEAAVEEDPGVWLARGGGHGADKVERGDGGEEGESGAEPAHDR